MWAQVPAVAVVVAVVAVVVGCTAVVEVVVEARAGQLLADSVNIRWPLSELMPVA